MEISSFPQRTGLGPVRKSYRKLGLRNGIFLGIRKKHIRIGNIFDCVEGVGAEGLWRWENAPTRVRILPYLNAKFINMHLFCKWCTSLLCVINLWFFWVMHLLRVIHVSFERSIRLFCGWYMSLLWVKYLLFLWVIQWIYSKTDSFKCLGCERYIFCA